MTRQANLSNEVLCGLETVVLRGESRAAANRKINANFLKGGFVRLSNSCAFYKQCRLFEVCASNPPFKKLRLSLMRYASCLDDSANLNKLLKTKRNKIYF